MYQWNLYRFEWMLVGNRWCVLDGVGLDDDWSEGDRVS